MFLSENDFELTDFNLDKYASELEGLADSSNKFDADKSKYALAYLAKLKEEELRNEYDFGNEVDAIDEEKIIELAKMATPIEFDEEVGKVYFLKGDGSKHFIVFSDDEKKNVFTRKVVASLLPEVTFDVAQGGILEQAKEAEAIYTVLTVNKVFGGIFTKRIRRLLYQFDVKKLEGPNGKFTSLLTKIEQDSTAVIRILVSACNIKLTEVKTKKEAKLYTSLNTLIIILYLYMMS